MIVDQIMALLSARSNSEVIRLYIGPHDFFEGIILDPNFVGMVVLEQNSGDKNVIYVSHTAILAVERLP